MGRQKGPNADRWRTLAPPPRLATASTRVGTLDRSRLAHLTKRELEVLTKVGRGASNDEIAAALHISPATSRTYVSGLLTKFHARDRAQLVVLAYETGLIIPGD